MSIKNSWWAEKYRPTTVDEYVADPEFATKLRGWIEKGEIPHLLLYSEKSGTGKTTAAKLIASQLDADVLYINASDDNNIDTVRDTIKQFVSTVGFSRWKIVIGDEFSRFTPAGQSALNGIMETFSRNARFILTCNYIEQVLPSIQSRCTKFQIETPPKTAILKRLQFILESENVAYDVKDVATVIKELYPDQRSIINYLQDNSGTGTLVMSTAHIVKSEIGSAIVDELNSGQPSKTIFTKIRQIIADSKIRQFTEVYRYLFEHLDGYVPDGKRGMVILSIADYQYKDAFVVDKEINIMALIVNILNIIK